MRLRTGLGFLWASFSPSSFPFLPFLPLHSAFLALPVRHAHTIYHMKIEADRCGTEYSAQKGNTPPAFSDIPQVGPLEPRFVCSVKIDERIEPFVDQSHSLPRKKLAKQFACQLAMVWLAENGYISPLRVPKLAEFHGDGGEQAGEEFKSAASRVPEVCKELGITPPAYRFTNTPEQPMVWSGYAIFALCEDITGEVGRFEGVLGRKNAKEMCAQNVLKFLEGYRRRKAKML